MGARKQFTPEFKREAVQLVESGNRSASERLGRFSLRHCHHYAGKYSPRATRCPLSKRPADLLLHRVS
jgi:hypothetical protein